MFLTFVVPTANRVKVLMRTLQFLHTSAHENAADIEVIVINDGIDDISNIVTLFPAVRLFNNPRSGVASARNYGVEIARSDNIVLMDDDILMTSESLRNIIFFFQSAEAENSCYSIVWEYPYELLNECRKTNLGKYLLKNKYTSMRGWADQDWKDNEEFEIEQAASFLLCIKKQLYLKVGGYNETYAFSGFEDYDFAVRLKNAGIRAILSTKTVVYHYDIQNLNLITWLARRYREGFTRAQYVRNTGDTSKEISPDKLKGMVYAVFYRSRNIIGFLVKALNRKLFDFAAFQLIGGLTGAAIYKGYVDGNKKIKILAVFSGIDWASEFYWYAKYLDKKHFELVVVLMHNKKPELMRALHQLGIRSYWIKYTGKKGIPLSFMKILFIFLRERPQIVHPQLFEASLLTLLVARILGFRRRIHTRHHGDYHHIYHPHAVKYDRLINSLSRFIICPSEENQRVLITSEAVDEQKVKVIRHGFDFDDFSVQHLERVKSKYGIDGWPIIGVISRLVEWKGVQYVVEAFRQLVRDEPQALLVVVGTGDEYESQIKTMLRNIPDSHYRHIDFERDIYSLISLFDIFVHVPVSASAESFGQVYIEAMALAVPMIITLSGIAVHEPIFQENSKVVPYRDARAILEAIREMISNYALWKDKAIEGSLRIREKYDFQHKIRAIERLYYHLMYV